MMATPIKMAPFWILSLLAGAIGIEALVEPIGRASVRSAGSQLDSAVRGDWRVADHVPWYEDIEEDDGAYTTRSTNHQQHSTNFQRRAAQQQRQELYDDEYPEAKIVLENWQIDRDDYPPSRYPSTTTYRQAAVRPKDNRSQESQSGPMQSQQQKEKSYEYPEATKSVENWQIDREDFPPSRYPSMTYRQGATKPKIGNQQLHSQPRRSPQRRPKIPVVKRSEEDYYSPSKYPTTTHRQDATRRNSREQEEDSRRSAKQQQREGRMAPENRYPETKSFMEEFELDQENYLPPPYLNNPTRETMRLEKEDLEYESRRRKARRDPVEQLSWDSSPREHREKDRKVNLPPPNIRKPPTFQTNKKTEYETRRRTGQRDPRRGPVGRYTKDSGFMDGRRKDRDQNLPPRENRENWEENLPPPNIRKPPPFQINKKPEYETRRRTDQKDPRRGPVEGYSNNSGFMDGRNDRDQNLPPPYLRKPEPREPTKFQHQYKDRKCAPQQRPNQLESRIGPVKPYAQENGFVEATQKDRDEYLPSPYSRRPLPQQNPGPLKRGQELRRQRDTRPHRVPEEEYHEEDRFMEAQRKDPDGYLSSPYPRKPSEQQQRQPSREMDPQRGTIERRAPSPAAKEYPNDDRFMENRQSDKSKNPNSPFLKKPIRQRKKSLERDIQRKRIGQQPRRDPTEEHVGDQDEFLPPPYLRKPQNRDYLPPQYNWKPQHLNTTPLPRDQERTIAAGLGTGVLGLLVGGPIGAAVLGFTSAYAAENVKENTVIGDSARAIGDVALAAKNRGVELNEKHRVVDKTIQAAGDAWEKAKNFDREHRLLQKAKDVALYGSVASVDFVKKHNLVSEGAKGIGKSIGWVSDKVQAGSLDGTASSRIRMRSAMPPPPRALDKAEYQRPSRSQADKDYGTEIRPSTPYDQFNIGPGGSRNFDLMPMRMDGSDPWAGQRSKVEEWRGTRSDQEYW